MTKFNNRHSERSEESIAMLTRYKCWILRYAQSDSGNKNTGFSR